MSRIKWVAIVAAIAIAFGVLNARQADASDLPHGVTNHCAFKWDWGIPYVKCSAIVQPGTTAEENVKLQKYRAEGAAYLVFAAGLACAGITGPLAPVCALIAGTYATLIANAFKDAAAKHRCVRFRYESSHPTGPGLNFHVEPYGQPQQWVSVWSNTWHAYVWVWKNVDSCKTRNPQTPKPVVPANPWGDTGFF